MDVARCVCGHLFEPHEPNDPQLAVELAARAAQAARAAEAAAQTTAVEPENTLKATEAARARIGREYLAIRAAQTAEEARAVIQRAAREPENNRKMAQALKVQRAAIASEIVLDEPCADAGCQSNPDPARAVQGGASDVPTRIERRMSAASPVKAFITDQVANVMKTAALQTLRETIVVAPGTKSKKSFVANQVIKVMKATAAPTGKSMPDTQSTKSGERFRANQAAKALKALKTTLSVETKCCSSCGTTLEASASRCRCGHTF